MKVRLHFTHLPRREKRRTNYELTSSPSLAALVWSPRSHSSHRTPRRRLPSASSRLSESFPPCSLPSHPPVYTLRTLDLTYLRRPSSPNSHLSRVVALLSLSLFSPSSSEPHPALSRSLKFAFFPNRHCCNHAIVLYLRLAALRKDVPRVRFRTEEGGKTGCFFWRYHAAQREGFDRVLRGGQGHCR